MPTQTASDNAGTLSNHDRDPPPETTDTNAMAKEADNPEAQQPESEYHLDVLSTADGDYSLTEDVTDEPSQTESEGSGRPWVGIHFECCNVYARVYRQPNISKYVGRCPRCMRQVTLRVGPQGVSGRIFKATPI